MEFLYICMTTHDQRSALLRDELVQACLYVQPCTTRTSPCSNIIQVSNGMGSRASEYSSRFKPSLWGHALRSIKERLSTHSTLYQSIFALRSLFLKDAFFLSCSLFSLATFFLRFREIYQDMVEAVGEGRGSYNQAQAHCFAICFTFSSSTSGGIRDSAARSRQACIFSSASSKLSLSQRHSVSMYPTYPSPKASLKGILTPASVSRYL